MESFDQVTIERVRANSLKIRENIVTCPISELIDRGLIDKTLEYLFKLSEENSLPILIGGGCFESLMSGKAPKDYDVFFISEDDFDDFYDLLEKDDFIPSKKLSEVKKEDRFIEFVKEDIKIQAIKTMYYSSIEELVGSFDFTVTMFGVSMGKVCYHCMAPIDVLRKKLVLGNMTFPASTIRRLIKYTTKGYYLCGGSAQIIANEVNKCLSEHPDSNGIVYVD